MPNNRISPLFTWRSAIASEDGPDSATTRHVLLTLSLYMSQKGDSCFPGLSTLAEDTGLDKSTVSKHLKKASQGGWIDKEPEYDDEGQRAGTNYFSRCPVDDDQPPVDDDQPPVDDDQPNTSYNTPSSNNSARGVDENHQALEAYRDVFPRSLRLRQKEKIISVVEDVETWEAVLDWWAMNGYKPKSVGRMLNKYRQADGPDDLYRDVSSNNGSSSSSDKSREII